MKIVIRDYLNKDDYDYEDMLDRRDAIRSDNAAYIKPQVDVFIRDRSVPDPKVMKRFEKVVYE